VTELIYTLSQQASAWLSRVADFLPVGYAFGAGMVSTVNPCGFALLPAYLGLFLGRGTEQAAQNSAWRRLTQALLVAAAVSSGFVVLFGAAGLVIAATGSLLIEAVPWIGLGVGVFLAAVALWLLTGHTLYASLPQRLAARLASPRQGGMRGFFGFGLAYGTASLSCTLPIFLSVVGTGFAVRGALAAAGQFVGYALGMGLVIGVLTVGLALFSGATVGLLRKTLPYFRTLSAALLFLAGAYIVYYWLSTGQLALQLFS
jgi:cytochrome c biogenesis protein CcdA